MLPDVEKHQANRILWIVMERLKDLDAVLEQESARRRF